MTTEVMVAYISGATAIALLLIGILAELMRSRRQSNTRLDATIASQEKLNETLHDLNRTINDMDKRLVAVETTVSYLHPRADKGYENE